MTRKSIGFTLVEVMIVVAIIGILAGVAYPSYLEQVRKSNRSDAKIALSDVAQRLQRCFTAHSTYKPTTAGTCDVVDQVTSAAGITSTEGFYVVKLDSADHQVATYLLKATPIAGQRQAQDKCTLFTLNQAGVKKAYKGSTDITDECW
jgi:type IV pilus assembly protein PilE